MYNNRFYAIDRFTKILEKVDAGDLFDENDEGLTVLVHNGRILDAFRINVEFPEGSVLITTHSFIGVEEPNYDRVKCLLESINNLTNTGLFFIGDQYENNVISFSSRHEFDELAALNNPFDAVFLGCELFARYTEAILKTMLGSHIYYIIG